MRKIFYTLLTISILASCSSSKNVRLKKETKALLNDALFDNQFLGFFVFDPIKNDTLVRHNSAKYFTPASNTKIITLYTAMNVLPEKIPALNYIITNDTLYIQGTGDPTLLHSYFEDSTAITFLKNHKNIALSLNNFQDKKYGPGWAWEDYDTYFQPERNAFPMFGNVVTMNNQSNLEVVPTYFKDSVSTRDKSLAREEFRNTFYYNLIKKDTVEVPFIIDAELTQKLLENELHQKVTLTNTFPSGPKETLFSVLSDTVYKRMMKVSDNFLAEQLLILSSGVLSDTLNVTNSQKYILSNQLSDLKQPPRWVDGSGLSRYNLFTPESFVHILTKMYQEQPIERLFDLFPTKGVTGNQSNRLDHSNQTYIYAKSGSFGNNYSLSGYLLTKSGKTLIFSFMNNHYKESTAEIKKKMEVIFENIRDNY